MSFRWVGFSTISTQQRRLRDYPEWKGSMFPKLNWGLLTEKPGCKAFFNTHSNTDIASYKEQSHLLELQLTSQPCDTHQGFVRSQNNWCRESQELQESCYYQCPGGQATEKWHHRGTMRHPQEWQDRTSPRWFTWQTVALLLCYWILTHTMPWHHSSRLHCLSSATLTRPTTSAKNYQRSFTSWVDVRSC